MRKQSVSNEFNGFVHPRPTEIEHRLGEKIKIKIDRPMGSRHPKHGFIYPINYGYVPGVMGGDGEELDAYLLGVFEPVKEYEGRLIAIIHRYDDYEEKLVVASKFYTIEQIRALVEFQERWFKSFIAYYYDKPYWPDTFNPFAPDVQKAIEIAVKNGKYSITGTQALLKRGYEYCRALGCWLEDQGVVRKQKGLKPKMLRVKTFEEAMKKIKEANEQNNTLTPYKS